MTALPQHRVALLVEYDGTNFAGLQRQLHTAETIQGKIEAAAATIGASPSRFIAAGRTDSGVHALGQVVVLELPKRLEQKRIRRTLNSLLPPEIRIRTAVICDPDFSPRHDAVQRTYLYQLSLRDEVCPIRMNHVAVDLRQLEPELTIAATKLFQGKLEMREWRSSRCQAKRTLLNIDEASALPPDPTPESPFALPRRYWTFRFSARSFVHHQVRFMVGGIASVGAGDLSLEELADALRAGKRPIRAKVMPACGLIFREVKFAPGKDPFA